MKGLLGLTACMLPLLSLAEFVVPVDSVEEHVNVRMVADAKSEIVGRLYRGDAAKLVKAGPEWHEIEIAGGATGYISADWTLLVDDVGKDAAPDAPVSNTTAQDGRIEESNVADLTIEEAREVVAALSRVVNMQQNRIAELESRLAERN